MQNISGQSFATVFLYTAAFALLIVSFQILKPQRIYLTQRSVNLIFPAFVLLNYYFPSSVELTLAFAVFAGVTDFSGLVSYPLLIEKRVKPSLYRESFLEFGLAGVIGRVLASILMLALSQWNMESLSTYILLVLWAWQLYGFRFILQMQEVAVGSPKADSKNDLQAVYDALKFIYKNPVMRVACFLLVWAQVNRFFLDQAYYIEMDKAFSEDGKIAFYLSLLNFVSTVLSIGFLKFVSSRLFDSLSLSALVFIIPTSVLMFSLPALFLAPFFWVVFGSIVYATMFRGVLKPVARQLLLSSPAHKNQIVILAVTLITTVVNVLNSFFVKEVGLILDTELILISVSFLAVLLLIVVGQLDSHYIKNIWHNLKLHPKVGFKAHETKINFKGAEKMALEYSEAKDQSSLLKLMRAHSNALSIMPESELRPYLKLIARMRPDLVKTVFSQLSSTKKFSQSLEQVRAESSTENDFVSLLRTSHDSQINRQQILRFLREVVWEREHYPYLEKLKTALNLPGDLPLDLIEFLGDPDLDSSHDYLFEMLTEKGVSILPGLENLMLLDYYESVSLRRMIASLSKYDPSSVEAFVLDKLDVNSFEKMSKHQLSHLLFLSEVLTTPKAISKLIRESIPEIFLIDGNANKSMYVSMHLQFLVKSPFHKQWKTCLNNLQ